MENKLTAEVAREFFRYDEHIGKIFWIKSRKRINVGDEAGSPTHHGYRIVGIFGKRYLSHRLAWLIATGNWPENEIDHINGDTSDNRLVNLRPATRRQNSANRRNWPLGVSGLRGVSRKGKYLWKARINTGGGEKHLGVFESKNEAHEAYRQAAIQLYGEYSPLSD